MEFLQMNVILTYFWNGARNERKLKAGNQA